MKTIWPCACVHCSMNGSTKFQIMSGYNTRYISRIHFFEFLQNFRKIFIVFSLPTSYKSQRITSRSARVLV